MSRDSFRYSIEYIILFFNFIFQIHNPLFLNLKPSKTHLAMGLVRFFEANFWYDFILVIEKELLTDGFYNGVKSFGSDRRWRIHDQFVSSTESLESITKFISSILSDKPRIIVLHTRVPLAKRIFLAAEHAHMMDKSHAWFITENSYTRESKDLKNYPEGTLTLLSNNAVDDNDVIRDSTTLISAAIRKFPSEVKDAILKANRGCWENIPNAMFEDLGKSIYK